MRAFTLRSAERQVELQDELSRKRPGAASEVNGASGVDRKFTAGIIGVTILVPIVILIIIVGIVRTRCNTRRTRGTTNAAHGVDPNNGGTFFRVTPNPNGGVPIENGAMQVNSSSDDALHGQHDFTWSDPMSNGKESKHCSAFSYLFLQGFVIFSEKCWKFESRATHFFPGVASSSNRIANKVSLPQFSVPSFTTLFFQFHCLSSQQRIFCVTLLTHIIWWICHFCVSLTEMASFTDVCLL